MYCRGLGRGWSLAWRRCQCWLFSLDGRRGSLEIPQWGWEQFMNSEFMFAEYTLTKLLWKWTALSSGFRLRFYLLCCWLLLLLFPSVNVDLCLSAKHRALVFDWKMKTSHHISYDAQVRTWQSVVKYISPPPLLVNVVLLKCVNASVCVCVNNRFFSELLVSHLSVLLLSCHHASFGYATLLWKANV